MIERLDTDAAFRRKLIDQIRSEPSLDPAPTRLPAEICKRIADELAGGKVPAELRGRLEDDLKNRCDK